MYISIVFDEKEIIEIKKYKDLVNSISINAPVETIKAKLPISYTLRVFILSL